MAIYNENIVDIELTGGNIFRSFLSHTIGSGDVLANRFGVRVFRNGEPENIGGTCFGLFIRADGTTVTISSGVVSGNLAYVTLPEACYAVEGNFTLAIKVSGSGETGTMRIVDGVVSRTSTSAAVDPGTLVPSIEDLIDAIEDAVESIPADYSSLWTSLAPAFSTSTAYSAGQYVTYNGGLYRFILAHAAGTWNTAHVVAVDLGDDVSALKSAITEKKGSIFPSEPTGHGLYLSDGTYEENAGWASYYIPIPGGVRFEVVFTGTTSQYNNLNEYAEDGTFIKTHGRVNNMVFTSDDNARFIGCATVNADIGKLNIFQTFVRGEIEELANHVNENGIMTRDSFSNAKTYRPFSNVSSGTTFYFRAVSTTDASLTGLSVYGLNTGEDAEFLASQNFGGQISKFTTAKNYENIQISLAPYPADSFTGTVVYDYLISQERGIIQDICELQAESIPRNLNTKIVRLFQKVICIGDSYTEGYIWLDGDGGRTIEPMYAWPHFMELETGNKWVNCGVSGSNVFTWQESEYGYQKAVNSGRAQAYIIGLMINDRSQSERGVPLGTASDIGTNNFTYYAGMSQLIRRINALNPLAKIFVNTCPAAPIEGGYNEAVRVIVETYKNTYPVYCLDLARSQLFTYMNHTFQDDAMGGHYTGIGYEQMAEVLAYAISKYIGENIPQFQNVHQIPFDE